jgi:hypothetical protein
MILEDGSFDVAVTCYYISFVLIVNWILLQARSVVVNCTHPPSFS